LYKIRSPKLVGWVLDELALLKGLKVLKINPNPFLENKRRIPHY